MPRDIEEQLAGVVRFLDRESSPITLEELVEMSAASVVPGRSSSRSIPDVDETDPDGSSVVIGGGGRRPARRIRPALVVGTVFVWVLLAGIVQLLLSGDHPDAAGTAHVTSAPDLGVFEPLRGWIVYPSGGNLEAVDPDNPSSRWTVELPRTAAWSAPVGWSADGSLLLLDDEKDGKWSVMNDSGEISFTGSGGGCCLFVYSNWLSPDGTSVIGGEAGEVEIVNLTTGDSRPLFDEYELDGVFGLRAETWSPDGSQIAFAAEREIGMSVIVVDATTGEVRELADSAMQYVRHLTWSPDGEHILATSADLPFKANDDSNPSNNPLLFPQPSHLYQFDVDGSGRREIASGHFVAASWSPDGSRIAALDYGRMGRTVVLMGADGHGETVIFGAEPDGPFTGIAWHPVP